MTNLYEAPNSWTYYGEAEGEIMKGNGRARKARGKGWKGKKGKGKDPRSARKKSEKRVKRENVHKPKSARVKAKNKVSAKPRRAPASDSRQEDDEDNHAKVTVRNATRGNLTISTVLPQGRGKKSGRSRRSAEKPSFLFRLARPALAGVMGLLGQRSAYEGMRSLIKLPLTSFPRA